MPTPTQRKKLDDALVNFQQTFLDLSRKLKKAAKRIDDSYDFLDLCRASKLLADTTEKNIQFAPFFAAKQSLEGVQHYREWLLHSTDYTGELREQMLDSIQAYEVAILAHVGFLEKEPPQMELFLKRTL